MCILTSLLKLCKSVYILQKKVYTHILIQRLARYTWPWHHCQFKGCGMDTLFVLLSPCFRENVVVKCKIGSFLCSLDNLLQKNVIVFFFWKSNFKMALIWKKGLFLTYFSHFLVTRENLQKFLQHISYIHTCILLTLLTFFALPILKKI